MMVVMVMVVISWTAPAPISPVSVIPWVTPCPVPVIWVVPRVPGIVISPVPAVVPWVPPGTVECHRCVVCPRVEAEIEVQVRSVSDCDRCHILVECDCGRLAVRYGHCLLATVVEKVYLRAFCLCYKFFRTVVSRQLCDCTVPVAVEIYAVLES